MVGEGRVVEEREEEVDEVEVIWVEVEVEDNKDKDKDKDKIVKVIIKQHPPFPLLRPFHLLVRTYAIFNILYYFLFLILVLHLNNLLN